MTKLDDFDADMGRLRELSDRILAALPGAPILLVKAMYERAATVTNGAPQ